MRGTRWRWRTDNIDIRGVFGGDGGGIRTGEEGIVRIG